MSEGRRLRSIAACQPLDNIFKDPQYREILPPQIYNKVIKTPSINCEKIKGLKLEPGADHL